MKLWLASYPRSGNTFFRNILYYCYGIESSTYHDGLSYSLDPAYASFEIVKTHLLPHQLPSSLQSVPKVYLVRDGRDALVSMAHQKKDLIEQGTDFETNLQEAIIAADGTFFGGWSENVTEWMNCADIVIRYEDLIHEPIATVERLRTLMDLPQPDITKLPTFEKLKSGESYFGIDELKGFKSEDKQMVSQAFFRKGKAGGWREEMPTFLHDLLWNYHGETMERLGYSYSGALKEMDDVYDYSWKNKIYPIAPTPVSKRKILIEANKVLLPSRDGVKRYVMELVKAYEDLETDLRDRLQIDVLVLDKIYPLQMYEKLTVDLDLHPYRKHYTYEEILLGIKAGIKAIVPHRIYESIAPLYRNTNIRKGLLDLKNRVTIGRLTASVKVVTNDKNETRNPIKSYDLIHVPLPQNYGQFAQAAYKMVFTVHDVSHKLFPGYHQESNAALAEAGMNFIKERQASIIAISNATKADIIAQYGIAADTIKVVHEAADRKKFRYNINKHFAATVREKYHIGDSPYFLALCTIEPRKNLDSLIKAFDSLCDELPNSIFKLVIVGNKGWKYEPILKHNARHSSRILFTGFVPDSELSALYSSAVAFCYVSHYEGFGLPLVEAMSCRVPVIAADNSSMPEVVGDSGILISATDIAAMTAAMKSLLTDEALREEKAKQAWKQSFTYSWRKTAIETLQWYEEILGSK